MEIGACAGGVAGENLEAKMSALHALGYDFIEPAWKPEDFLAPEAFGRELRALGDRTGCPIRSAIYGAFPDLGPRLREARSRGLELEQLAHACMALEIAGGDVLLLPNWAGEHAPDFDKLYADFLREAADNAAPHGVRLAIEHIPSSKYRNTAAAVAGLAGLAGRANVGVYYDIANGLHCGDDPVASARAVADRVLQYHVKDYKKGGRALEEMPLDEVKGIFEVAGYRGRVAVEMSPTEPEGSRTNRHLEAALAVLKKHGF